MIKTQLVSIIISAFNAEKYIALTLDSILQQTYPSIEIIVVNDGSTDKTISVLETYSDKIKIITQPNKGQDAALNNGYKNCSGDYIKFMDSDDLINSEMIEFQVNALEGSDQHIAYGEWARFYNADYINADFTKLDNWENMDPVDFLTSQSLGPMLQCGIMLIPRKIIEKSGLWDERLILFNDTEFFTRVLLNSMGIKFSQGARLYYRSGLPTSVSVQKTEKHYISTLLATDLISQHLLSKENSKRVRKLIGNIYKNQYCDMYPRYPDLLNLYRVKVLSYPEATYEISGGKLFLFLKFIFGWKIAKRIKNHLYKLGYKPSSLIDG
jgi:glycosyltransferase involved in cell wall biosynthesis